MSNDRKITEAWYDFMSQNSDIDDPTSPDIARAEEEIAQLEAMIESLEENIKMHKARIQYLREQISYDVSASREPDMME